MAALSRPPALAQTRLTSVSCTSRITSKELGSSFWAKGQFRPLVSLPPHSLVKTKNCAPQISCGLFGLGFPELAVIAGVAVVLFGPKQLPEIGKGLGKTVKSFQQAAKEFESELKSNAEIKEPESESQNVVPPSPSPPPSPAPPSSSPPPPPKKPE